MHRLTKRRALGLAFVASVAFGVWFLWPSGQMPDMQSEYDVHVKPTDLLPPGTSVPDSAPEGWTHLVLKTYPRIRPTDREKVNGLIIRYSEWLRTAFVADVRPGTNGKFRLQRIALGLAAPTGAGDVIVTPDSAEQHGVELGLISRQLLTKAHELQRQSMVPVFGPSFAVVDYPVWFRCGEKNRAVRFRYGMLVDPNSGKLDVWVWGHDPNGDGFPEPVACRVCLGSRDEAELIPDPSEISLGLPTMAAFGVDRFPPFESALPIPDNIRKLAASPTFTPEQALALEMGLRSLGR